MIDVHSRKIYYESILPINNCPTNHAYMNCFKDYVALWTRLESLFIMKELWLDINYFNCWMLLKWYMRVLTLISHDPGSMKSFLSNYFWNNCNFFFIMYAIILLLHKEKPMRYHHKILLNFFFSQVCLKL